MESRTALWTGRTLTGLFAAFILIASVAPKLVQADVAKESLIQLGWDERHLLLLGLIELTCLILYLVPRTAILGAVLTTGLLGGAIATQLRVDNPLFSHTLFGIYLGLVMWAGLWLRDPQLRRLLPLQNRLQAPLPTNPGRKA